MKQIRSSFISLLCISLLVCPTRSSALPPPAGQETLCKVTGHILSLTKAEASDMHMSPITVPAVTLEIKDIHAVDKNDDGNVCNLPSLIKQPSLFKGKKRINTYRICGDAPPLAVGNHIKGITGKSLGGGPYCIEHIKIFN